MDDMLLRQMAHGPGAFSSLGTDLERYQAEYRGIVFGHGTPFHIEGEVEGLLDAVMRVGDRPVPRGHGYIQGPDYAEARVVIFTVVVAETPHSDRLAEVLAAARAAFLPTPDGDHWLRWNLIGDTVAVHGRVVRSKVAYGPKSAREGRYRIIVEFRAADPFIYDDAETTATVPLFGVSDRGGFDLPSELPLDMTPVQSTRTNIVQDGSVMAWPLIRFQNNAGTASWMQATNLTTGVVMRIDTAVSSGAVLVADMFTYQRSLPGPHIHIDGQSRFGDWQHPRTPFGLAPGDNLIQFDSDSTDAVCRFTWRTTWL